MMTEACNLRMNRIIQKLEKHKSEYILKRIPDSIEFPSSFHERLFDLISDLWGQNEYQSFEENILGKIISRKDFPQSLHEKNFSRRGENQFYFFAALHSPYLSVEQIEMLFDEFFQAGGFSKIKGDASPWGIRIKHLIEEKFDERLTKKYTNNFYLTETPEYFKKVLQYFNEDELFDFLVLHENALASGEHLFLLAQKTLSDSTIERIMKHCEKSNYLNPMKDIIKLSFCHDPNEIHRITHKCIKNDKVFPPNIILENPFAHERTIKMMVENVLIKNPFFCFPEKILSDNEKYGFVHENISSFIKKSFLSIKKYKRDPDEIINGFSQLIYNTIMYAPVEKTVDFVKELLKICPIFDYEMMFPRFMARGVEDEALWQKFLKSERVFINENEFRSSFWNSIPLKFLTLVSPEDMGTEPLLGIYARKELPDGLRNALFDEIKKRMENESGERFDTLTSLISNVLLGNDTLPKLQSDIIKEFVLNHMGKEIETFIPCSYFSNTDLIKKMVSLGEENEDLKIQILESGVFPEFLRESFDAPPEWEKRQENRTEVSASI